VAVATNLGTGGSVLDAQFGSSPTSNTNEPLLLGHTGENHLYLPGVSGNTASTPDAAALDISGDVEVVMRMAQDIWTPTSGNPTPFAKGFGNGYYLFLSSTNIGFGIKIAGGAATFPQVAWSGRPANGVSVWVKATRVASTGVTTFYTAADSATEPTAWTTIGTTTGTSGNIENSPESLVIGRGTDTAGRYYRAIVRDGINGTTVFDADFTTGITSGAQTTFTATTGQTVTINRSTAGRKSVAVVRPVWLLGTDDFFEVADNALLDFGASDSFTVVAVVRQWATPTAAGRYANKGNATGARWALFGNTGQAVTGLLNDGTNSANPSGPAMTAGNLSVLAGVVNRTAATNTTYTNSVAGAPVSTSSVGSVANAASFRVGSSSDGAVFQDFELLAVAVFRRALTAGELALIAAYYGAV
jgi:hypothetical protein